jgi:hypothetical protein
VLAHLLLTFRHRAGVRPYTSSCDFAEPCVFAKQLPPPGLCPSRPVARTEGLLIPKLRRQYCRVPSTSFSQAPWYALPVHLCRFRVRSDGELFPGTTRQQEKSSNPSLLPSSVTHPWLTNINVIPIDYAFRPHLRDRLTLRRLTLRRNPWTFGDTVFHSVCRYSCQHSHFQYLQDASRLSLQRLMERSATACT